MQSSTQQPVYLALAGAGERNTVHIYGKGLDIIPPQRPNGAGQDVFVDQAVGQPGFYMLSTANGIDTTQVALNQDKRESLLEFRDVKDLKNEWKGENVKWLSINDNGSIDKTDGSSFPLLFLEGRAAESYLKFIWNPSLQFVGLLIAWQGFRYLFGPIRQIAEQALYAGAG